MKSMECQVASEREGEGGPWEGRGEGGVWRVSDMEPGREGRFWEKLQSKNLAAESVQGSQVEIRERKERRARERERERERERKRERDRETEREPGC